MRRPAASEPVARAALGGLFAVAGTLHFVNPRMYERIVPHYLPHAHTLVLVSGAAEIVGGAAVLATPTRRLARWWLIALLVAVFPANVEMALHPGRFRIPGVLLWLRLPLQGVLGWWVYRATRD